MAARLYQERADLYDVVYQWKDYAGEASGVSDLLAGFAVGPGARVLEAACGTGSYLVHLRDRYDVAGFDVSPGMLGVARAKLPGVPLYEADLVDVRPEDVGGGDYAAVLCLFSGIGYIWPESRLRQAVARLAALLRPGGVLVIEPWLQPGGYAVGRPSLQTAALPHFEADPIDVLVARGGVAEERWEGDCHLSVLDLHYMIVPRDGTVETFVERHELWLCPPETLVAAARDAGLDAGFEADEGPTGRGLLLAVKPA